MGRGARSPLRAWKQTQFPPPRVQNKADPNIPIDRAVCDAAPAPLPPACASLRPQELFPRPGLRPWGNRQSPLRAVGFRSCDDGVGLLSERSECPGCAGVATTGSVPPVSGANDRGGRVPSPKVMGRGARSPLRAWKQTQFPPPRVQNKADPNIPIDRAVCDAVPAPLPPACASLRPQEPFPRPGLRPWGNRQSPLRAVGFRSCYYGVGPPSERSERPGGRVPSPKVMGRGARSLSEHATQTPFSATSMQSNLGSLSGQATEALSPLRQASGWPIGGLVRGWMGKIWK